MANLPAQQSEFKVLHVASGDRWAGAEAQLLTLAKYQLRVAGVVVKVVLLNPGELARRLAAEGVCVTVVDEKNVGLLELLRALARELEAFKPDVVHSHRYKENILTAIANAVTVRCVSVRTVHGDREPPTAFISNLRSTLLMFMNHLAGRYLQQGMIAVSAELATKLSRQYPHKVAAIHNGVDREQLGCGCRVDAAEIRRSLVGRHVGFAGRIEPVKRVDLFVRTAALINADSAEPCYFHVFGEGSLEKEMRELARCCGVEQRVIFHGHQQDLLPQLKAMDVLMLCSDHEGMPMVALESLALGIPVVAHRVGGLKQLLKDGRDGLLVDEQSPQAYGKKLQQAFLALQEGRLRPSLGTAFGAEQNASDTLNFYKILQARQG